MPTLEVSLPPLHPGQELVDRHPARFKAVACGRRWGKTRLGVRACVATALAGGIAWWVAPSYPVASIGWRAIKRLALQVPGAEAREVERMVTLPGSGWLQVRSADDPDSLRGEGLDLAVLDECAFMAEPAWSQALRPALSDRRGRALFLSTPKGRNWFYHLYLRGQDGGDAEIASWNRPTTDNPTIDAAEVEQARQDMPERWYRQEYLAEFLDDSGGVMRGVRRAISERTTSGPAFIGVDWGQVADYTVFTAIRSGHVVGFERMHEVGWELQLDRLRRFCDEHQPALVMPESNSMGGPLVERLQAELPYPVQGFVTTAPSKRALIDRLALDLERGAVSYPDLPQLVNELEAYEYTTTPAGNLKMGAPAGYHDDCVMSLALAHWAEVMVGGVGTFSELAGALRQAEEQHGPNRPLVGALRW